MTDTFEQIADKFAITEQLYRYCRSVDRLDVPLGQSVFHEDATADYGPTSFRGTGHGAIEYICKAHLHMLAHSHQVTNILIELDSERAGSEAYVMATLRIEQEGKLKLIEVWARYCDRWSKRDGVWRIDHRDTVIDYDSVRDVTPMNHHEWATRDPQDPSYTALGANR
ncbi:nuclear transport factor 2 family protein [Novosphingobium album (ex Hu et al. 2023)]|uniref:Nuclear transport factor 2 family protein n=1 Tax=Novosphingobium album (ex Hu et al. 2023) TaxID=2930093 RepID=A0ABT0B350_9SPHN|nr:nuclear transport factor 2 family protein [Novosphingobium album (ex Hu et al. 2023)]MCJ2179313.1 nuclear transport factor 2 family protein [Novosphingobium album (ex Hu et al. 2023)]